MAKSILKIVLSSRGLLKTTLNHMLPTIGKTGAQSSQASMALMSSQSYTIIKIPTKRSTISSPAVLLTQPCKVLNPLVIAAAIAPATSTRSLLKHMSIDTQHNTDSKVSKDDKNNPGHPCLSIMA